MVEKLIDNIRIAVFWKSLVFTCVIVIVISESNRKSFDNTCWQLNRVNSPLLDRVIPEKCVVQFAADESQRLLFEVARVLNAFVSARFDEALRLSRGKSFAEELIYCH